MYLLRSLLTLECGAAFAKHFDFFKEFVGESRVCRFFCESLSPKRSNYDKIELSNTPNKKDLRDERGLEAFCSIRRDKYVLLR